MIDINGDDKYSFWATVVAWVVGGVVFCTLIFCVNSCSVDQAQRYGFQEGVTAATDVDAVRKGEFRVDQ